MKSPITQLISTGLIPILCLLSFDALAETHSITLGQVTEKISNQNFFVLENAQRVYQAKQTIQLARRNLLPKLNLWRIIEAPISPRGLLGIVGDIAPFLVPNNWLRVKEEKLFAEASRHGYDALWANELLTARGLLLQANLEEHLLESLRAHRVELDRVGEIVESREKLGAIPPGSSLFTKIQIINAQEEYSNLSRIVQENRSQLAFMLGFPGGDEVVPTEVQYSRHEEDVPLNEDDFEAAIVDASPEVKQFSALIRAAGVVKKGRYFTFLGSNSMSRGTGGGIFDDLPFQDGLGFGLAPSIRIVKSERKVLSLRRDAVQETLKKDLKVLVTSYNLDIQTRLDAIQSLGLTENLFRGLEDRMRLGENIEAIELIQASEMRMSALAAYHAVQVRILLNRDRLERMQLQGAYSL